MHTLDYIYVLLFQKDIIFETLKVVASMMKGNLYIRGGGSSEIDSFVSCRFRTCRRIHIRMGLKRKAQVAPPQLLIGASRLI